MTTSIRTRKIAIPLAMLTALGLLISLSSLSPSPSAAAESKAVSDQEIYAMLESIGSAKIAEQVIDSLSQSFTQVNPNIPPAFWTEMKKAIKTDDLFKLIVPIYRKNLTNEDLRAMIGFYKSPAGLRISKAMPAIGQESMAVGQGWGRNLAEKIAGEAKKRGYKI